MNLKLLLMIFTCVSLAAFSQLIMKVGMSAPPIQAALNNGHKIAALLAAATNIYVIIGLGLYVAGAGFWLIVLSQVDVSVAYPFVGLGFVLTMFLGWLFLNEPVGFERIAGTLMVVAGVYLVSTN